MFLLEPIYINMERKKQIKADLEKKRGVYSSIALLFAFAIVLIAFEYRTTSGAFEEPDQTAIPDLFEEDPSIVSFVKPPPPPPPPPVVNLSFLIDENPDEDPIEFASIDIDEDTKIKPIVVPKLVEEVIIEDNIPVLIAEKMPEFPGGLKSLFSYLGNNINYPIIAKDTGIEGIVFVSFVIAKDGSITTVKVLRGIGGGCDEEAMRVVNAMPKWKPGKQGGRKVAVQYNIPINFVLK